MKNISAGEVLTISYLPFGGVSASERQLHLMRVFELDCRCGLCTEDLPVLQL